MVGRFIDLAAESLRKDGCGSAFVHLRPLRTHKTLMLGLEDVLGLDFFIVGM